MTAENRDDYTVVVPFRLRDRGRSRSVLSLSSPATTLAGASWRAVTITACVLPASPRRSTPGGWSGCCAPRCSGRHSSSTMGILTAYDDDEPALSWPTALQPEATVPAAIYPAPGYRIFVTAGRPVPKDPAVDPDACRAAIIELTCALHEPVGREGFEIAAELYSGVDFEPSAAGRLLRLWAILECLSERTTRSPAV